MVERPTVAEVDPPSPGWISVIRVVNSVTAVLGTVVSAGLMLGISADVMRRLLTGRSIPGMIELMETFMVIVVFLGLAHAEAVGTHVRMSLVTNVLPARIRRVVKSFGMLVCAVGATWFAWASSLRAFESTQTGEVRPGLLRFPVWPARIVIAIGFTILIFEYFARVWEEWHFRPDASDPESSQAYEFADEMDGGD